MKRPLGRFRLAAVAAVTVAVLTVGSTPAFAAQTATWGWTTDTFTMSFFGGIPYVGCEKARLTVPNSGSSGDIDAKTWTSIVVGVGAQCSDSTLPSSLNANTIKTRAQVFRNGGLLSGCSSAVVYNSGGQGSISASTGSNCEKSTTADATWTVRGYYAWWDYDDAVWRSEIIARPKIKD